MIIGRRPAALLSLVLGLLLVAPLGVAAQQTGVNLLVRDTRLLDDGVTELVVSVTGPDAPNVVAADAFQVTEQGQPVGDTEVEPLLGSAAENVALSLAIDVSGSMAGEPLEVTQAAAIDLVTELTELGVQVQVLTFAADVEVLTGFTTDTDEVVGALQALQTVSGTALYEAIVTAAGELEQLDGQRNLIVFSDGADSTSPSSLDDATAAAVDADVPIVLVALQTDFVDPAALDTLAGTTGGRVLSTTELDEIDALFDEVTAEIASQYVLRYTSDEFDAETLQLAVAVDVDGAQDEASFVVTNTRETPSSALPAPTVVSPGAGLFSNPAVLYAGILAAFVALLLVFMLLFTGARTQGDKALQAQLSRYIEQGDLRAGRSGSVGAYFRDRAFELFESTPRPKGFDAKLARRLEQAAWPLRNSEFLALVVVPALVVGLLVGLLINPLGGFLLGLVAALVPVAILNIRRQKRHDAFLKALPDTLQLMAGSLRAGYGVLQAIDTVAKESSPPTSEEFGRVLTEARLGLAVEDALAEMADRIDNDDFRWVVLAINIQREVGGNLAELLDTVAEVLREREMLRRQVKVLSAEGRLSAYILIGLPIFLAIYLILVRPEYIATLVTSGLFGWLLVGGALFLMFVGIIWIRNLIKIEV